MKKVVCALATLAFISSINVVFADDLMRFRLNGNSIYDQPYGDRNEFPCPDRLGSCTMTDSDYRSTRKGQSLEVFDTLYEAKQHLNFKPQLPSGLEGLRSVHVSIVDHDVLQVVYAYHELLKGTYFDRVDDMPKLAYSASNCAFTAGSIRKLIEAVLAIVSPPVTSIVMQMLYNCDLITANCKHNTYLFLDKKYL